jgi:hypothetical protein
LGGLAELDDGPLKVGGGLEALVDGGETEVGDGIEDPEPLEDADPETVAADLGASGPGVFLDLGDEGVDGLGSDGAAGDGAVDAAQELGAFEGLALAGALHDHERELDDPLLGGEPAAAGQALSAAPDRDALVGRPGIDDLVVVGQAERAAHPITVSLTRRHGVGGATRSRGQVQGFAGDEGPVPVDRGELIDDGPRVVVGGEPLGDAPEGVSGSHDHGVGGNRAGAALGSCEG